MFVLFIFSNPLYVIFYIPVRVLDRWIKDSLFYFIEALLKGHGADEPKSIK